MTPEEFENYLFRTRAELNSSFKEANEITDFDVYIKLVLDHQERIAKVLFDELYSINVAISKFRGDLMNDNRKRFTMIMDKLSEKQ
ncbi:hypothetical protein [Flavobacterium humi]|uniref:Uncharacterized protein n=1 Tax=Flavobacterium humi TaxID=2562683 RepID=A0A4Z0L5W1_9FLAO|nr:hypothetical protein [Flavobacterium humi]TGD56543.1 hypothetical protein E4635_15595 [Flavobacterium humi]